MQIEEVKKSLAGRSKNIGSQGQQVFVRKSKKFGQAVKKNYQGQKELAAESKNAQRNNKHLVGG